MYVGFKEDDTNAHLQLLTTSDAKMRAPKSSFALRVELFHAERTPHSCCEQVLRIRLQVMPIQ
jgi:hypothetical protein